MTWNELKEYANGLDESQLEKNVQLWQESGSINDIYAMKLKHDHFMKKDGSDEDDGCYPLSETSHPKNELKKVYSKGHPLLCENF